MKQTFLTVLSFGGGQDSTAILYRIVHDKAFREKYVNGDLLVIFSDTGDEHEATYKHLRHIKIYCIMHGIKFVHLTPDMGYHPRMWQSLRSYFEHYRNIMTRTFNKSCTDNLKIRPIYSYLNDFVADRYFMGDPNLKTRKKALYAFTKFFGVKINMIIGIAAGEEKRVDGKESTDAWMRLNVQRIYPLIEEGMDRQACQQYILSVGQEVPPPSNCMLCPFLSDIEILWLFRNHPKDFNYWVEREADKILNFRERGKPDDKNKGVSGTKDLLTDRLVKIQSKYGHMTNEELQEYKMSHGHCVKSTY